MLKIKIVRVTEKTSKSQEKMVCLSNILKFLQVSDKIARNRKPLNNALCKEDKEKTRAETFLSKNLATLCLYRTDSTPTL